jgi:hypothetical protein
MRAVKAPNDWSKIIYEYPEMKPEEVSIFLAGSIDNGEAEEWQEYVTEQFACCDNAVILNPRRDDWNPSWDCSTNNPQFVEQVNWELSNLDNADFILLYFSPTSKAPISLLELGLFHDKENMIVVCPEGYYRKGNVDIVCDKYNITQLDTLEDAINYIKFQIIED